MAEIISIPSNAIIYDIDIYIDRQTKIPFVNAKQYDTGVRYIRASIWDNDSFYPMVETDVIAFTATKPDRNPLFNTAGIDINGKIVYEITDQTSSVFGVFNAEFRIYNTKIVGLENVSTLKTTYDFKMNVAKSNVQDTEIISTPEFNALTDAMASVGDLTASVNEVIALANTAISDSNTATTNSITATGLSTTATTNATSAAALANEKAELADTKASLADAKATLANNAATATNDLNTTVTNQEALRVSAETDREANEVIRQDFYDAYEVCEAYNPLTPYVVWNKVIYQGGTYQNILASTGVAPTYNTDNVNWKCIATKGTDGAGGDMFKNVYDPNNKATDTFNSSNIVYDNSISGMTATNVKTALDELKAGQVTVDQSIIEDSTNPVSGGAVFDAFESINLGLAEKVSTVNGTSPDSNGNVELTIPEVDTSTLATKAELTAAVSPKTDKTYVDNLAASLASGSPKATYATVSALTTAFPTGNTNIYVVTADGTWRYWSGSAWVSGGIYQSTGIADNAVTPLKTSFMTVNTNVNLFNNATAVSGTINKNDGTVRTTGTYDYLAKTCDFIPVEEGHIYSHDCTWSIGFYDSDHVFISGYDGANTTPILTIGSNIAFVRISGVAANTLHFVQGSSVVAEELLFKTDRYAEDLLRQLVRIPYFNTIFISALNQGLVSGRWAGKTANFLGDSITAGYGLVPTTDNYTKTVKELLMLKTLNNYGVSASMLCHHPARTDAYIERYQDMYAGADLVVVFGSPNDFRNGRQLGTVDSTDNETMYRAMNILLSGIYTDNPTASVVFITPLQDNSDSNNIYTPNASGFYQKDYVRVMKEVANLYSTKVLDLFAESDINEITSSEFTQEGLHPTAIGAVKIGDRIARFLNNI